MKFRNIYIFKKLQMKLYKNFKKLVKFKRVVQI